MKLFPKTMAVLLLGSLLMVISCGSPTTQIENLRVAYAEKPLAVEDENPLFGWQMTSDVIGQGQQAYQIKVTKEDGSQIWDSGKVERGISNNIAYEGDALEPETAYTWNLTVWDVEGKTYTQTSSFETGLMDPTMAAWDGAGACTAALSLL